MIFILQNDDKDGGSYLPTMRTGRVCAAQMKIQPVRRRGQQRRASRRLVNAMMMMTRMMTMMTMTMMMMMMWMSCLLFLIIKLWMVKFSKLIACFVEDAQDDFICFKDHSADLPARSLIKPPIRQAGMPAYR